MFFLLEHKCGELLQQKQKNLKGAFSTMLKIENATSSK
jgi:hypothetical protein